MDKKIRKIILTERQFSELMLFESKHFPIFLKPLMLDVSEFTKKCVNNSIKNNIVSNDYYFQPSECDYTNLIILKITLKKSENVSLSDFESMYHSAYINPINEKFDYTTISLTVPYNKENSFISPFIDVCIFHEIEHMYDDWMRQINGGYSSVEDVLEKNVLELYNLIESKYKDNKFLMAIANIAYLSIKDEEKAFLTQTYAELQNIKCNRFNYKEKIKETISFKQYNNVLKNCIPTIKSCSDEDLLLLNNLVQNYETINIPKNKKNYSLYRNSLIKWGEHTAHTFIKKFGGVLTQYLEDNDIIKINKISNENK